MVSFQVLMKQHTAGSKCYDIMVFRLPSRLGHSKGSEQLVWTDVQCVLRNHPQLTG